MQRYSAKSHCTSHYVVASPILEEVDSILNDIISQRGGFAAKIVSFPF